MKKIYCILCYDEKLGITYLCNGAYKKEEEALEVIKERDPGVIIKKLKDKVYFDEVNIILYRIEEVYYSETKNIQQ